MMSVLLLIPAIGLEIMAIGVTNKDFDSMTNTKPKLKLLRKYFKFQMNIC